MWKWENQSVVRSTSRHGRSFQLQNLRNYDYNQRVKYFPPARHSKFSDEWNLNYLLFSYCNNYSQKLKKISQFLLFTCCIVILGYILYSSIKIISFKAKSDSNTDNLKKKILSTEQFQENSEQRDDFNFLLKSNYCWT